MHHTMTTWRCGCIHPRILDLTIRESGWLHVPVPTG
jgi:hypothetical protein